MKDGPHQDCHPDVSLGIEVAAPLPHRTSGLRARNCAYPERLMRFELTTYTLATCRSNQLSYNRIATVPLQLSLYAMAGTDNRARAQSIDLLWFYSLCGHFHPKG